MGIVAGIVLLGLAVAVYARHLREAGWLVVLRLAVVLLLAAILADWAPSFHWTTRPRRVVMLVDRSLSMSAGSADTLALAAARRFPVAADTRVETWAFGDTAFRVVDDEPRMANDRHTRMGQALRAVTRTRPGAVVVVSDGQDNGELDPVRVAKEAGIPVYAVGCGRAGGRNLAAVSVTPPLEVYAGDTAPVLARLRYEGVGDEEVTVRLDGGMKQVRLRDEVAEQEFFFRTVFPKPGRQLVQFSVDSVPGESDYLDNEKTVAVEVKPGRVHVTYVTNRPGFGTRFLTGMLKQLAWVELSEAVQTGAGGPATGTGDADVFVLDGISGEGDGTESIAQKVRQGAGALVVAGPDFRPGKTLTGLLPGGAGVTTRQGDFAPVLAGAGRVFSWLAGIQFDKVPPFTLLMEPQSEEKGEAWLVAGEPPSPAMLAYEVGAGRVVYVAGHPLWRWGFGPGRQPGQNPLELFLAGVVRYLAEQDRERFRLASDRLMFHLGEPVRLVLAARAPDGSAWAGLDVSVSADSGPAVPMVERTPGVYEAELGAVGAGAHRAVATVSMDDSVLGRAVAGFAVSEREVELASAGLNRDLLAALAQASGGSYFRWDSLPQEGFEPALAVIRHGFGFEPRRSLWAYALIAVLVGAEMVLRRRKGLL